MLAYIQDIIEAKQCLCDKLLQEKIDTLMQGQAKYVDMWATDPLEIKAKLTLEIVMAEPVLLHALKAFAVKVDWRRLGTSVAACGSHSWCCSGTIC